MEDFPSNSQRQSDPETPKARKNAPEEKKVERVVSGDVKRRKKPLGKRFKETFFGGADAKSVWGFVVLDVLIPSLKDMTADAASMGVERMLFGDSARGRRPGMRRGGSGSPFGSGYTQYNRTTTGPIGGSQPASYRPANRDPREMSRRGRATHEFDEIVIESRSEAEDVIDQLFELVGKYNVVSVSELYNLVGITPNYTDDKYGWTDLRGAGVSRARGGGYLLDLPKPDLLD